MLFTIDINKLIISIINLGICYIAERSEKVAGSTVSIFSKARCILDAEVDFAKTDFINCQKNYTFFMHSREYQ